MERPRGRVIDDYFFFFAPAFLAVFLAAGLAAAFFFAGAFLVAMLSCLAFGEVGPHATCALA